MAVVYKGVDRKLERRVAIKVMDPRLSLTPGMAQRFLQEARIAARLQHPNIIVVHDVRQNDEIIYFVMSLIDGIGVDELCEQPIPVEQARWILLQASRALAYAHSEDIVHRDIKPANILLNGKGDVVLTDFGIAKALGETGLTQSGTQVGTPLYMSPEQFSGVAVGPAADQYALGVTAYQMIAGRPPFSGDLYQLIAAHGNKAPEPLLKLRPECPAFLANAVMRMLEKNPADRWPSLDELVEVLGTNVAMDGGTDRRRLAETVRARRSEAVRPGDMTPVTPIARTERMVVTILPPGATIFVSGTLDFRANVSLDTGQSLPGANVMWSSSDESVLRVQPNGTVVGYSPGTAVIRASVNGGFSDAVVRVEAAPIARLSLSAPQLTMRIGDLVQPSVVALDVNGVERSDVALAWISRSPGIADIVAPGVVRAITAGTAVIDVSYGNIRRSIDIAVARRQVTSIQVTGTTPSLQMGESVELRAESFDDLGARVDGVPVRWTSSAPAVVHVDSTGRALAISPGRARVTASVDDATTEFELVSLDLPIGSIQLTLAESIFELGDDVAYSVRAKDTNGAPRSAGGVRVWSTTESVVQLDTTAQRLLCVGVGAADICAAPDDIDEHDLPNDARVVRVPVVVSDVRVADASITPNTVELEIGAVVAARAIALDRRGRQVSSVLPVWSSANPEIATVDAEGMVRAVAPGSADITARFPDGGSSTVEARLTLRVRRAPVARLTLTADRPTIEVGDRLTVRAAVWDASGAEVTGVTPMWRSTNPAVAQVDADGQVVALSEGRVSITAEHGGQTGQLALLVVPAAIVQLAIAPATDDVIVGRAVPLAVEAIDRNGTKATAAIEWRVEPADVASISSNGQLTVSRSGSVRVIASVVAPVASTGPIDATRVLQSRESITGASRPDALFAELSLVARDARVNGIRLSSTSQSLRVGKSARVRAMLDTEVGEMPLPASARWESETPDVVTCNALGDLVAAAPGFARVHCTVDGLQSTIDVTVTEASKRGSSALVAGGIGVAVLAVAAFVLLRPKSSESASSTIASPIASPIASGAGSNPSGVQEPNRGETGAPVTPSAGSGNAPIEKQNVNANSKRPTEKAPLVLPPAAPSPKPLATPLGAATNSKLPATLPTAKPSGAPSSGVTPSTVAPATQPQGVSNGSSVNSGTGTAAGGVGSAGGVTSNPPPAVAPPAAPPAAVTETPAKKEPPAPETVVEAPSGAELRAVAEQIVQGLRTGTYRQSNELLRFFSDGDSHKASLVGSPKVLDTQQGRVRAQFEVALSRYNAAGITERRTVTVDVEVARRNGAPALLSTQFSALAKGK